jgi:DNA-binding CsgD family transcriptional regulator
MLDGLSPGDIAEAHGVSVATVRTQVQAVFSRLGVQRQADLLRILGAAAALPG